MSDNASEEEQQQQMQEIFICADVWFEAFAFLCPFDVGLKIALISDRFDALVDEHFKSRKWSLDNFGIYRAKGNGAEILKYRTGKRLPIPQGPLPGKVIGFECISICYIDQTVVEFLQRIRRLFVSSRPTFAIHTDHDQNRSWEIIWQKIWPLVNDNISVLRLPLFDRPRLPLFDRLRQFSPAVLRNCPNLRSINFGLFPEFPAEDNVDASAAQAVAKWLITPHGDDLPKILHYHFKSAALMEGLKGSFVNASEPPVNFIICLFATSNFDIVPFELKNNWTGERLTLRRFDKYHWLLVRCPIGREEAKWAKWEKEAMKLTGDIIWNWFGVSFDDTHIGDGMVEANEGPREPNK